MNASSKNKNEKLGHHYLSFYVFFFLPKNQIFHLFLFCITKEFFREIDSFDFTSFFAPWNFFYFFFFTNFLYDFT